MNMRFFQLMLLCSITAFCTGSEGSKSTDKPAEAEAIAQAIRLNVLHQVMPLIAQGQPEVWLPVILRPHLMLTAEDKQDILKAVCTGTDAKTFETLWQNGFRFVEKDKYKALEGFTSKEVLSFLLKQDSTLSVHQLFRDAIRLGQDEKARWLWKEKGADPKHNDPRPFHYSAIHIAAMHNPAFLEELLRDVPPVDEKHMTLEHFDTLFNRSQWGTTPFHAAAAHGKLPSIRILLRLAFPVNRLDAIGNTALQRAARSACLDVARVLVEAGTDIEHLNGQGKTALTAPKDDGVDEQKHQLLLAFLRKQLEAVQEQKERVAKEKGDSK